MEDYLVIGTIINTHGVKGAVKVYPKTDDPKRFELLDSVKANKNGNIEILNIKTVQYQKNLLIIKFDEINDMNKATQYKNIDLIVDRDEALPLEDDEFYISDLIGVNVVTNDGTKLGKVKEILYTGGNDVYVVDTGEKDLLIPAIKDCVKEINLDENEMIIELMEGLID